MPQCKKCCTLPRFAELFGTLRKTDHVDHNIAVQSGDLCAIPMFSRTAVSEQFELFPGGMGLIGLHLRDIDHLVSSFHHWHEIGLCHAHHDDNSHRFPLCL